MADETLTPREIVRESLARDRDEGRERRLSEYLQLFPGREEDIAEEWFRSRIAGPSGSPWTSGAGFSSPGNGPAGEGPGRTRTDGTEGSHGDTRLGSGSTGSRPVSERVGPYRIVRELGRGGQGLVFLAEDSRLSRKVALKVLTTVGCVSPEVLARFRREAEVASRLDHPGICAVYETGAHEGIPFIAMRYVEGETLRDRIARSAEEKAAQSDVVIEFGHTGGAKEFRKPSGSQPLAAKTGGRSALEAMVRIIEKTARALHAAHEIGIVHRDIKPQNIMVSGDGEPVILDFGLARDLESDQPTLTQSGDIFGTPSYMSPEQLSGKGVLDRRTDVWSLGVTLYEALTGRRPFDAATREQLYQAILTQDPPDPKSRNPAIPSDLEVVLETAMEKDRDRRYQTALAFAEDLHRVLALEPIRARPAGAWLKLRRWVQRNPVFATLAGGLGVLAIVASALLSYGIGASEKAKIEKRAREMEQLERTRAEASAAELAQREMDRALREDLAKLQIALGCLQGLAQGKMNVGPITNEYLATYRSYGLPLDGDEDPMAVAERCGCHLRRDPEQGRMILEGIYDLATLLDVAGVSRAFDKRRGVVPAFATPELLAEWDAYLRDEPALVAAWASLVRFLEEVEFVPWRREVFAASRAWFAERKDGFDRFFAPEFLADKSAEDLAWLSRMIAPARFERPEIETLIERGLRLGPGVFDLHFSRGGLALYHARRSTGAAALRHLDLAIHHLEVAVALRPRAALLYGLVGSALGLRGDRDAGFAWIENGFRVSKHEPLLWFMKARFLADSKVPTDLPIAREAAREALALDEKLDLARDLLRELEAR